jgi:hypothetical protein
VNLWKRFCGDCEGMAHDVGDDDHAYEFVEEFLELKKTHVRTVDLGRACDLLTSRSIVAR